MTGRGPGAGPSEGDGEATRIDFESPEAVRDPWPRVAEAQRVGAVFRNAASGQWVVSTDRLCRKVLLDFETFSLRAVTAPFFGSSAFIAIDDKAAHDALRGVWAVAFQRATLDRLESVIAEVADAMLADMTARLRDGEAVDAVGALCRDLPAYVIAYMLGVPSDMQAKIVEWSDKMGAGGGVRLENRGSSPRWLTSEDAKALLADYLFEQITYRRSHPSDDLISQIVHSEVGARLSDEAIMQNTRQLLFAGNETTAKWLGHIVVTLAEHPAERRALASAPSSVPNAVEEVMRWQPVVQSIPRVVAQDGLIGEIAVRAGDQVMVLVAAANRDPARYDHPDRLDIDRAPKAHLGFGYGLHSCLGVNLARIEARVTTERLLAHVPDFQLAKPVEYGAFGLRGPSFAPIVLEGRA
jgi:cytochrome P450